MFIEHKNYQLENKIMFLIELHCGKNAVAYFY